MPPDSEQSHLAFVVLLKTSNLLVERLDRRLQERVRIQLNWYEALLHLRCSAAGRMTLKQLADNVMLTKSGVSRLVDRMEESGLVQRHACTDDGRVCYAAITPKGRAAYEVAQPVACDAVAEYFARHLTAEETEVVTNALLKVLASVGRDWVPTPEEELTGSA